MNRIFPILLIPVFLLLSACLKKAVQPSSENKPVSVPKVVKAKFKETFPNATGIDWDKEGKYYEVEFLSDDYEMEVVYDMAGNVFQEETIIPADELPAKILNYLQENFPDNPVSEAERVVSDGEALYEVELEDPTREIELLFTGQGLFLELEIEDNDE